MAHPISESEIEKTETQIGARLPSAYRESMKASNGKDNAVTDEDEWELHPIKDTSDRKRISLTAYDILKETESARDWRGFPKEGIVIGNNGMGDLLILRQTEEGIEDVIYAFWHETGEVTKIADSFDQLERE